MSREQELQDIVDKAEAEGRDLGAESQAVVDEIEEARKQEQVKALSVKERLKRRLTSGYIEIPFKDDLGPFPVKMRLPSPAMRKHFVQLTIEAENALNAEVKDEKLMDKLNDEMCGILGYLCLDFDAEYILSGEHFGIDIVQKLMEIIIGVKPVNMDEYRFFRSPQSG